MENVQNREKLENIKKYECEKKTKQQSKIIFNGIIKSYENSDSYIISKNEVLMGKPIYLVFAVLEL